MHVYRTSKFNQKAQQHNLQTQVDKLCAKLFHQDLDQVQAHFQRLFPYLKRKLDNNYRIVGRIIIVDGVLVLCLLDIFKRGGKEYLHFIADPTGFGQQYLDPQSLKDSLRSWLAERLAAAGPPQELRPLLQTQADLLPWLDPPGWENHTDGALIYESQEWQTQFGRPEIQQDAQIYSRILDRIAHSPNNAAEATVRSGVQLYGEDRRYVLFSRMQAADGERQVIFLLTPFTEKPSAAQIAQVAQTVNLESIDELTSRARRAYPSYLLATENWLLATGSKQVNLALSAEEEEILYPETTAVAGNGHKSLPLFLNGRAGSGKSTMLFYLFADYCYRKAESGHRLQGNPLFLTYNDRLLEVAKDWVQQLLAKHHRFVASRQDGQKIPDISSYFQPFQKFLLHQLPLEVGGEYNLDKYISFHRFKQHYQNCHLPQAKRYSPEHAWHAIRTFIKGYGREEMTPEEYREEVPRKEQTLGYDQFREIYQIYHKWYKILTTKSGYWDDQDLISKVLELECYSSEYTAIFCDEAQDFTRLELQLILRLSVFSQYNLGYQPIASLPFAFAGDPFQTLNPTGFRWESFKAAFHNEVITALDPAGELHLEMNFQELKSNYRSCSPIVQFNNLIQLWRHLLFNQRELQPQTAWKQGELAPQKFIIGTHISPEELLGYVRDTIVIIPCEEGEEIAYIEQDEVLHKIVESQEIPPKNVLSPIAAKGLEFKRVILYKFGEACDGGVWQYLNMPPLERNGSGPSLEVEYFFNKLYVAASRAIERLFVVDSPTGEEQLWRYASNTADYEKLIADRKEWNSQVRPLTIGTAESAQELEEDDPESIAQEFETEGLNARSAERMRRAKGYYLRLNNSRKVEICEAWALKFEERWQAAGHSFEKLGEMDAAFDCFWQGLCWSELMAWYDQHGEGQQEVRPLVEFMAACGERSRTGDRKQWQQISTFTRYLQSCLEERDDGGRSSENLLEKNRFSRQWQQAIAAYGEGLSSFGEQQLSRPQWQQFGEILEALHSCGYGKMLTRAGDCFYRAAQYDRAVACYTQCQGTQKREYYLAQAQLRGFPAGLSDLEEAGEGLRIVAEWEKADQPRDRQWLKYVAPALEKQQRYQRAFLAYIWLDEPAKVKACFTKAKGRYQGKLLRFWLRYLVRKQQWYEAIALGEQYGRKKRFPQSWKWDFVYQLASSRLLPEKLPRGDRMRYESWFRKQILAKSEWQDHLEMQQLGVALERIGGLGMTLDFYQPFCEHREREIRQFARERWLVTKKKQSEYHTSKGESHKAEEMRSELASKSRYWKIALETVAVKPPKVPTNRPILADPKPLAAVAISGLPENVMVEHLADGVEIFQIGRLTVRVMRREKQILIADPQTDGTIRVDLAKYQVKIGDVTLQGNRLSFTVPVSGYGGVMLRKGDGVRLELDFADLPNKINIEMT